MKNILITPLRFLGYGNVTPTNTLGQIACIVYTLIGIPLHVIMMRLLSFKFRGGLRKCFKTAQSFKPESKSLLVVVGSIFFMLWAIIFLLIPTGIISVFEQWSYTRAFYFIFVTLTTIGLGDLVVGK